MKKKQTIKHINHTNALVQSTYRRKRSILTLDRIGWFLVGFGLAILAGFVR